ARTRRTVGDRKTRGDEKTRGGGIRSTTPGRAWCSWLAPERRFQRRRQSESRSYRPRRSRSRPGRPARGRRKISPWRGRFLSWYHLVMPKRASVVSEKRAIQTSSLPMGAILQFARQAFV